MPCAVKQVRPDAVANCGRSGECKRTKEEIGISSLRMGSVVGIHEVHIHTGTQCLTLRHEAANRGMFADGAVEAAKFLADKGPMGSVVGIHEVHIHTGTQCLTLRHEAANRGMFADGAVEAAKFLADKGPGLYSVDMLLA